ncbi:MAG: hypothetical protein U0W24_20780 [Bacteroidales bacterium]
MLKKYPSNQKIPIGEIGRSFIIKEISDDDFMNNIVGKIIFTEASGENVLEYVWHKHEDIPINIDIMRKNGHIKFEPEFVEFKSEVIPGNVMVEF